MVRYAPRPFAGLVLGLAVLALSTLATARVAEAPPERPDGLAGLMPVPASVTPSEGRFRVDPALTIAGPAEPQSRSFKAASRFMARLAGRTGLFFKQDFLKSQAPGGETGIQYTYARIGHLLLNEDEPPRPSVVR